MGRSGQNGSNRRHVPQGAQPRQAAVAGDPFEGAEVIDVYSRTQAIEDGVLADIDELFPGLAREQGVIVPVTCTSELWDTWIVPDDWGRSFGQSERERMRDVFLMYHVAARQAPATEDALLFNVCFLRKQQEIEALGLEEGDDDYLAEVTLKAVMGRGDRYEPSLTFMLPHES
jgi:hypothetical protein